MTVLPPASRTVTAGWAANATWLTVLALGCPVNASWVAAPTEIVKLALVAEVIPPEVAVSV